MCGDLCNAKYHVVGDVVFLSKDQHPPHPRPFAHVYVSKRYGDDFAYRGTRDYVREDAGRIMGTVP